MHFLSKSHFATGPPTDVRPFQMLYAKRTEGHLELFINQYKQFHQQPKNRVQVSMSLENLTQQVLFEQSFSQ